QIEGTIGEASKFSFGSSFALSHTCIISHQIVAYTLIIFPTSNDQVRDVVILVGKISQFHVGVVVFKNSLLLPLLFAPHDKDLPKEDERGTAHCCLALLAL